MRSHIRRAIVVAAAATTVTTLTGGLPGLPGAQEARAAAGPAPTRYADDFNGDGYHDLAIGAPDGGVRVTGADGATTRALEAGYVTVSYGSKNGAQKTGLKAVTQNSPGVPGDAKPNQAFGRTLANGDFNADGYADLAVGSRSENRDQVTLLWGGPTGLKGGSTMPGTEAGPGFGSVLKAGDFTGDGKTDLIVGYSMAIRLHKGPFKADGSPASAKTVDVGASFDYADAQKRLAVGRINKGAIDDLVVLGEERRRGRVLLGGASGLRRTAATVRGGNSVTIGDFDKDGYGDIAVGDSTYVRDSERHAGRVQVQYGSSGGVDEDRAAKVFTEDSPGVPGGVEAGDSFGIDVAAGDLNRDGYADLVVGAPGERHATCEHCYISGGGLYALKGSKKGLTGTGAVFTAYNAPGLPRPAGVYRIPRLLKITDLNGDKQPEITVPVRANASEVWSVGTKGGKIAGTAPTRVVKPPVDADVPWPGNEFGVLAR
ncbi:FG-GAP and VCBS repeat-containing protein [Streptomyces flavofungini]|uniref:FG-GAP and VCBS repeat-containing protein n=1 Tax=Streptomyces flavofungini TaxID=68200 RepID=UPI0025B0E853|nr:FG-GAP and VCBS repeat-containing protein [Streptomyces flavofungini]WJV50809.1 FG-GAP and VCBS repeat-containing protein [Streptomyces flavofungini]